MNIEGPTPKKGIKRNVEVISPFELEKTKGEKRLTPTAMAAMDDIQELDSESDEEEEIKIIEMPEDQPAWLEYVINRFDRLDMKMDKRLKKVEKKVSKIEGRVTINETNIKTNTDDVETLKKQVSTMRKEMINLKAGAGGLTRRVVSNEQQQYRQDLIIDGIPESDKETAAECLQQVQEEIANHIGHQMNQNSLQKCHRMGARPKAIPGKPPPKRPRGILAKFTWDSQSTHFYANQ